MARAYSMDLRQRVIDNCDRGMGTKAVALKYDVSPAWVRRLKQHRRERGDIKPRTGGHRPRKIDRQQLAQLVEQQPDATLEQLRERLGIDCAISTICQTLKQLKLTFKKSQSTQRSRIGRMSPSVACNGVSNS